MDAKLAISSNVDRMELERFNFSNCFIPPSFCGTSPTSKFWLTSRTWRDYKLPILEGILPSSIFCSNSKTLILSTLQVVWGSSHSDCLLPSYNGLKWIAFQFLNECYLRVGYCSKKVWEITSGTTDPLESFQLEELERGHGHLALLRCQVQVVSYQKSLLD